LKDDHIILTEYTADNQSAAKFEGQFQTKDPKQPDSKTLLTCDLFTGTWQDLKTNRSLPFYLYMDSGVGDLINNENVNKMIAGFKLAVIKRNKNEVAKYIDYPITVYLPGRKKMVINDPQSFIKHYDQIFTTKLQDIIAKEFTRLLFNKDGLLSLGSGNVWFKSDSGKVTTINP
jgi:hypothetical protein